jgi:hypothetical protein
MGLALTLRPARWASQIESWRVSPQMLGRLFRNEESGLMRHIFSFSWRSQREKCTYPYLGKLWTLSLIFQRLSEANYLRKPTRRIAEIVICFLQEPSRITTTLFVHRPGSMNNLVRKRHSRQVSQRRRPSGNRSDHMTEQGTKTVLKIFWLLDAKQEH